MNAMSDRRRLRASTIVGVTVGVLAIATNISALVWGAATMSHSVDNLNVAVEKLTATADDLRTEIVALQLRVGVVENDVQHLEKETR